MAIFISQNVSLGVCVPGPRIRSIYEGAEEHLVSVDWWHHDLKHPVWSLPRHPKVAWWVVVVSGASHVTWSELQERCLRTQNHESSFILLEMCTF